MGHNKYFQFKKFKIIQEKSAMKVGTDGVLLGAWVNLVNVKSALDVGAGTGLLALMLAQRSNAEITGIEIEKNAAEEAIENVKTTEWANRISIRNISFQEFAETTKEKFDLIISNPPFFSNSIKSKNQNRTIARHNDLLPFSSLIEGASKLLKINGKLAVVFPADQSLEFIETAHSFGLYLFRKLEIQPRPNIKPNRVLMEFGYKQCNLKIESLFVRNEMDNDYSKAYKKLTRDFYLHF